MTTTISRLALLPALFLAGTAGAGTIQEAIDHPGRPNSDREDDDRRHPVEIMTFAGVATGDVVFGNRRRPWLYHGVNIQNGG